MKASFGYTDFSKLKLVSFDLDGTLSESKMPLSQPMAHALQKLSALYDIAIISGGQLAQFQVQVLDRLNLGGLSRPLHLLPTCGTQYYRTNPGSRAGNLLTVYVRDLSPELRAKAKASLETCARELGLWEENPWGQIIEDRGTQVTFSALGQNAPLEAKRTWDPDGTKKSALVAAVAPRLPDLEVRSGGSTSVDVTARGIDKAYGMRELIGQIGLTQQEAIFVGDQLGTDGNDYPVVATGVACQAVTGPEDTIAFIEGLIQ